MDGWELIVIKTWVHS